MLVAEVIASMAGTIFKVLVAVGDEIEAGQDVIILESMKMEIPIPADVGGKVTAVNVGEGEFANEGDVLVTTE